jgi:hypothetical protein
MKNTAITLLFACALFCASCSDSTETTVATPSPVPELTAAEKAAIEKENKEAMKNKRAANGLPEETDATPSATP